jgi:hypothetical protein
MFALACLTRYEAWPVTACALAAAAWALWRRGRPLGGIAGTVGAIGVYPAVAVAGFGIFSRVVIGEWFASDFFVPDNKALGHPYDALAEIVWGTNMLSGGAILAIALVGAFAMLAVGLLDRRRGDALIALSLGATAALPWSAFVKGHPFRIRYMVPLIALEAVGAGVAAGVLTRVRLLAPCLLALVVAFDMRPLDRGAPMVVEAQWDRPNVPVRARLTDCLGPPGNTIVMASMGSLGQYMQETSAAGFRLKNFLHEGNGDIWIAALNDGPRPFADFVLIDEQREGGDMLAVRLRNNPHFLDGYSRTCEGAGIALYRRNARDQPAPEIVGRLRPAR